MLRPVEYIHELSGSTCSYNVLVPVAPMQRIIVNFNRAPRLY